MEGQGFSQGAILPMLGRAVGSHVLPLLRDSGIRFDNAAALESLLSRGEMLVSNATIELAMGMARSILADLLDSAYAGLRGRQGESKNTSPV